MSDTPNPRTGKFRTLNGANTAIGELRERVDELTRQLDLSHNAYAKACEEVRNLKAELRVARSAFGMAQAEGGQVAYNAYDDNGPTQRLLAVNAEAIRRHELGYFGRLWEDLRRAWKL